MFNDDALIHVYVQVGQPLDELPYVSKFDDLLAAYAARATADAEPHDVWKRLLYLRKKGRLPRLGRTPPPVGHAA